MADEPAPSQKKTKLPLLLAGIAALALGAGGFYAVYSGLILAGRGASGHDNASAVLPADLPPLAFVPIQPILVSVSRTEPERFLRFEGNLEVDPAYAAEVQRLMPRIMDVMNSYLRAVEIQDLRDPSALLRLRSQMLRRVQVVTGDGRVRDLLVTTFLIS